VLVRDSEILQVVALGQGEVPTPAFAAVRPQAGSYVGRPHRLEELACGRGAGSPFKVRKNNIMK
jgi:hypothetical protein